MTLGSVITLTMQVVLKKAAVVAKVKMKVVKVEQRVLKRAKEVKQKVVQGLKVAREQREHWQLKILR